MNTADKDEIGRVIQTYLDGLYEGDVEKLATAFHPTSALTTIADNGLTITPREKWLEIARGIDDLAAAGNASVREVRDGLGTTRRHAEAILRHWNQSRTTH